MLKEESHSGRVSDVDKKEEGFGEEFDGAVFSVGFEHGV
jgi:hypothetical protein